MKAPLCAKKPHSITQHGQTRNDAYSWLRDENWKEIVGGDLNFKDPEVLKYIEAENKFKDFVMKPHKDLETKLYGEILSRIKEDKESYPIRENTFYYFERESKGKNYAELCRFPWSEEFDNKPSDYDFSEEKKSAETYFDINKEADGQDLYSFRDSDVNEGNTLFAYMYNLTGSLECSLKVRDLNTKKDFDWQIDNLTGSFHWVSNTELYFIERDEQARGKKVFLIDVTKGPESKRLIFTKPDEFDNTFMGIGETTDEKFLVVTLSSGATQVTYLSEKGSHEFKYFIKGEDDITYSVEHHDGQFYILTNEDAEDFKVMKTSAEEKSWSVENWSEYIPEKKGRCLNEIHIYNNYMILECKNNEIGLPQISVTPISQPETLKAVPMPEAAYSLSFWGHWNPKSSNVLLGYNTPISSRQVLRLELADNSLETLHSDETPNFNSKNYTVRREFAEAKDGQLIPLTIIHKKDLKLDGNNPAFVYAYGSYGSGMPAYFSSTRFSLIDRGFVYCIAHIRGGDEKGNAWYLDGKMDKKMNTFTDYIDSCEYLIGNGYTSKGNITANGGSAGGLLMGAVTNMRPDLFKAVIADVAFVDVINTISDASLPLTPPEWEEWGNPIESEEDFNYMMQYSPYDNIKAQRYPSMLYNSGISDEQVTYWEPTKMVAKLREMKTDDNTLLLNMKMHAGHAGASKKYEWIEEIAFNFTFVLKENGFLE